MDCQGKPSEPPIPLSIVITPNLVDIQAPVVGKYQMIGFAQSALNQTEIEIRLACVAENVDMDFQVQYVIRSSPCDKEFFDAKRAENLKKLLSFYFDDPNHIPDAYNYDKIVYYKSKPTNFSCKVSAELSTPKDFNRKQKST
ncbi:unnamed protein product [Heligmosomoides polygyrus]|uniref:Uncharacterized protein n=1 Tax=Heligmosomoides polygyrus TaxID=6339 RepID=A0A3P8EWB6_HELPZ|nr:unnamed protein product [Heligmosomoides polygyrus]